MLGLSLRDLSAKLGHAVSHVALAKYEQGEMKPSGDVLVKLCEALGRSPDFMFRPTRVTLPKVSFRKREAFGEKNTAVLLEVVRNRLEDYLEAEELVPEPQRSWPKLDFPSSIDVGNLKPVRELAHQLRKQWGLGQEEPIANITELLENHGFRVIEIEVAGKDFDGCLLDGFHAIVVGLRADLPVARKRWTIAHELAHAVLNAWVTKLTLSVADQESVMNAFASEFLLPSAAIMKYFGQHRTTITLPELLAAKLRFGVSIEAIVYALCAHGIIGESAKRRFYSHIKAAWTKAGMAEPGDQNLAQVLKEDPVRFQRLVLRGLSEGAISLSRGAGLLGKSLADIRREAVPIVE